MSGNSAFEKVTVFVTSERSGKLHLLTFQHPLAGRQLPAGSVEEYEKPEVAALREVREETGIKTRMELKLLGSEETILHQEALLRSMQSLRQKPKAHPQSDTPILGRGHKVAVKSICGRWANVVQLLYDLNVTPATVVSELCGWVPRDQLAKSVLRYFYYGRIAEAGPDKWQNEADGYNFGVEWVPIMPMPRLVKGQDQWLHSWYKQLIEPAPRIFSLEKKQLQ